MTYTAYIDGQLYCKGESILELIWNLGAGIGASEYKDLIDQDRIHVHEDCVKIYMTIDPPEREWLFNFEEGGWNSVYALNKWHAIDKAKAKYADDLNLNPNEITFRISTQNDYSALMNQFN